MRTKSDGPQPPRARMAAGRGRAVRARGKAGAPGQLKKLGQVKAAKPKAARPAPEAMARPRSDTVRASKPALPKLPSAAAEASARPRSDTVRSSAPVAKGKATAPGQLKKIAGLKSAAPIATAKSGGRLPSITPPVSLPAGRVGVANNNALRKALGRPSR